MTDSNFYLEDDAGNPTIRERAIPGTRSTVDRVVAQQVGGVVAAYEDLAFTVLARVLAPDEATIERVAQEIRKGRHLQLTGSEPQVSWLAAEPESTGHYREQARAVLAALAEEPVVKP